MWEYGQYSCGMENGLGHLFNVIATVLVIVLIISFFRRRRGLGHHRCWGGMCGHGEGTKALDLLQERYVKGEIERTEYEQKKKDLTS